MEWQARKIEQRLTELGTFLLDQARSLPRALDPLADVGHADPAERTEDAAATEWAEFELSLRDERCRRLPARFCDGAAWSILLGLFVQGSPGQRIGLGRACTAAMSGSARALAELDAMKHEGLVRIEQRGQGETAMVALEERAHRQIAAYLSHAASRSPARPPTA